MNRTSTKQKDVCPRVRDRPETPSLDGIDGKEKSVVWRGRVDKELALHKGAFHWQGRHVSESVFTTARVVPRMTGVQGARKSKRLTMLALSCT